ncbi:MAG: hypothetical protein ACLFVK_05070 [Dehalococcoidia bacterium]
MLAVLCAIPQEFNSLLRKVKAGKITSESGFRMCEATYESKDILLVQTGPGRKKAERVTESVLQDYTVDGVVSLGLAGALDEKLAVGNLVLCRSLYSQTSNPSTPCHCDSDWVSSSLARAEQKEIALQEGNSVSVRVPVCDAITKKALAKEFPAVVVEMESYWIGQIAHSRGVPFLCIRAVSDALSDYLPPFDRLMNANGSWRKGKATLYFLPKPWRVAKLILLYRKMQQAAESLTNSFALIK